MMSTQNQRERRLAQLLVCSGCCCGHLEKGRASVPVTWLREQWAEHGLGPTIGLSITDCLGPCNRSNVACLKVALTTTWLYGLGEPALYEALLAWAIASNAAGRLLPLPGLIEQETVGPPSAASRAVRADDLGDVNERAFA
jgi:hypothetical protein